MCIYHVRFCDFIIIAKFAYNIIMFVFDARKIFIVVIYAHFICVCVGVMFSSPDVVATETNEDQDVLVCVIMTPPAGGLDRNAAVSDGESGGIVLRSYFVINFLSTCMIKPHPPL